MNLKSTTRLKEDAYAIEALLKSLLCATQKMINGSNSERDYFAEKYYKLKKMVEVSQWKSKRFFQNSERVTTV